MSGDDLWFDEDGDEFYDHELSDDESGEELSETVLCNRCGTEIYEDAVRCPACGTYLTHETNVWSGRPAWWIALGLLGILAVILTLTRLFTG